MLERNVGDPSSSMLNLSSALVGRQKDVCIVEEFVDIDLAIHMVQTNVPGSLTNPDKCFFSLASCHATLFKPWSVYLDEAPSTQWTNSMKPEIAGAKPIGTY